jgi:hypothetical protein
VGYFESKPPAAATDAEQWPSAIHLIALPVFALTQQPIDANYLGHLFR